MATSNDEAVPGSPWAADSPENVAEVVRRYNAGDLTFAPDAVRLIDDALPRLRDHLDECLSAWATAYPLST
jgi:hypothetical protein